MLRHLTLLRAPLALLLLLPAGSGLAQEAAAKPAQEIPVKDAEGRTFGHSMNGEAFNEGPRQRAYLMKGMAKIVFPITTKSALAQKFFEQGISQIHAYWYFEAERSFRQVAAIDPDCAMAYFGMTLANVNNEKRAKSFIAEAMKRLSKVTEREKLWIETWNAYYFPDPKTPKTSNARQSARIQALEAMNKKFPGDVEMMAFLAHDYLGARFADSKTRKREDIDKYMHEVLKLDPMHPVHHYLIHLWEDKNSFLSAANCGPSTPGAAHMWHMPGHTYSYTDRFKDAMYYQEASARVDHNYMLRDRIMPDQIHNYAHNNQWLVETLQYVGRAHDAIELAKNMVELPRHTAYNRIDGYGSASEGRRRLLETLYRYEMWAEVKQLDAQGYIEPTTNESKQVERFRILAVAGYASGDSTMGSKNVELLEEMLKKRRGGDENKTDGFIKTLEESISEAKAYLAVGMLNFADADKYLGQAKMISKERASRLRLTMGQGDKAEALAREAAGRRRNEVEPLANLVYVLFNTGKKEEAKKLFGDLQRVASYADLDTPLMAKITPIALTFGASSDWRLPDAPATDTGLRPRLETLGPFRWQPAAAPGLALRDGFGKIVNLESYRRAGKPVMVLFFLGSACKQCMEQLAAFADAKADYAKAGIELVAVSTDSPDKLKGFMQQPGNREKFSFPVLADPRYGAFKAFRAYDDFEDMPLHGSYLIDSRGLVRWQDIGFQPFKEAKFALNESIQLLARPIILKPTEKGVAASSTQKRVETGTNR